MPWQERLIEAVSGSVFEILVGTLVASGLAVFYWLPFASALSIVWFITGVVPYIYWRFSGAVFRNGTRVVECASLARLLGVKGIALWPIAVLEENALTERGNDTVCLRHERIHLAQQRECLVLPFYVLYVAEMVYRAVTRDPQPYFGICFEAEAYANERKASHTYFGGARPRFAFASYFRLRNDDVSCPEE